MIPKIKICGLTTINDCFLLNEFQVDYAGIVMFYERSKRYNTVENANELIKYLDKGIKKVAVTVSPTLEQVKIIEELGFEFIQIHSELSDDVIKHTRLNIFRAFNVSGNINIGSYNNINNIVGYTFDGMVSGSGEKFDWTILKRLDRGNKKLMLAGGLNKDNVLEAIKIVKPDIVDVSSGVELKDKKGKDRTKIKEFIGKVIAYE